VPLGNMNAPASPPHTHTRMCTHTSPRVSAHTQLHPCVQPWVHANSPFPLRSPRCVHTPSSWHVPAMHTHLHFSCVPRMHASIPPAAHVLALVHLCVHTPSRVHPHRKPLSQHRGWQPPQGWRRTNGSMPPQLCQAGFSRQAAIAP